MSKLKYNAQPKTRKENGRTYIEAKANEFSFVKDSEGNLLAVAVIPVTAGKPSSTGVTIGHGFGSTGYKQFRIKGIPARAEFKIMAKPEQKEEKIADIEI